MIIKASHIHPQDVFVKESTKYVVDSVHFAENRTLIELKCRRVANERRRRFLFPWDLEVDTIGHLQFAEIKHEGKFFVKRYSEKQLKYLAERSPYLNLNSSPQIPEPDTVDAWAYPPQTQRARNRGVAGVYTRNYPVTASDVWVETAPGNFYYTSSTGEATPQPELLVPPSLASTARSILSEGFGTVSSGTLASASATFLQEQQRQMQTNVERAEQELQRMAERNRIRARAQDLAILEHNEEESF